MRKKLFAYLQYILPQHLLSVLIGQLAEARLPWLKNWLINQFIKIYSVNLQEAAIENREDYPTFNSFFIRQLKPNARPIAAGAQDIACPADGILAQIGQMNQNQLLQAKQSYFNLETLLGGDTALAQYYYDGSYATLYLAPHNYHRVHMPLSGKLIQTIYIPGRLFSVNRMTSELIPHLYSRNERLVCLFETEEAGKIAILLVGAMIVGHIQTVWMDKPVRSSKICVTSYTAQAITLKKGDELGYFNMGSTVILLAQKNKIEWLSSLKANDTIQVGQLIGQVK